MPERVAITGATGFVGSAVARAFLRAGYAVRVLLRDSSPREALSGLEVETANADLAVPQTFSAALAGCQGLVHVAADYRLFVTDPKPLYRVNVEGTRTLMQAALAAGVKRIVYTSSVAALGHGDGGAPADEDTPSRLAGMIGHYKRSKFLAEAEVARLVAESGLPAVIVNPSAPVGPRDRKPTPTGQMVLDAACGRMPAYLDTGLNIVHVDDVAEGHRLAYERGRIGRRYVVGGDNLPLKDIFAAIAQLAGQRPPRWRLTAGPLVPLAWLAESWARLTHSMPRLTREQLAMARHPMYYSSARAERELGYTHRPADAAFRDALTWFAEHGYWKPHARRLESPQPRAGASPR
jgi:dihydroflavonol-4-reductase